jgi:hypothetical protein
VYNDPINGLVSVGKLAAEQADAFLINKNTHPSAKHFVIMQWRKYSAQAILDIIIVNNNWN